MSEEIQKPAADKPQEDVAKRTGDVVAQFDSTVSEYKSLFSEMEEDFRFKTGDQWSASEKAAMKGRPMIVLNRILKTVKIITGFQTQNFADITVLPEETSDTEKSQIFSHLVKWVISQRSNKRHVCGSFADGVTCGRGWIGVDLVYDRDLLSGDIVVGQPTPYSVMPDPTSGEPDLSDAQYVFRHAWKTKDEARMMYPKAKEAIDEAKEEDPSDTGISESTPKAKGAKRILIIEKWYRTIEEKHTIVDPESAEVLDVTGIDPILLAEKYPDSEPLTKNVPIIKLITVVKGGGILYDGPHPHGVDEFPFVPVYGYYEPSCNDLSLKIQGIVRALKDPQREKNKRRSQIMQSVLSMPYGGMMYTDGAFDKLSDWEVSKGGIKFLKVLDFAKFKEIKAADLPASIVGMEQMSDQDMVTIGPNPDILGDQMSKSEPGINIQLRQKQGMMAVQEFFDNLSFAKQILGKYIIKVILANWEDEKVARITGQPIPDGWLSEAGDMTYDCAVDEIRESQTYKTATFQMLKDLAQQGVNIPPETFVQMAEMPESEKQYALDPMKKQRELQMLQLDLQIAQTKAMIQQMANPPQPPAAAPPEPEQVPAEPPAAAEPLPEEDPIPPMEEAPEFQQS